MRPKAVRKSIDGTAKIADTSLQEYSLMFLKLPKISSTLAVAENDRLSAEQNSRYCQKFSATFLGCIKVLECFSVHWNGSSFNRKQ